jgi:16S rRNA (uracil1498-N3)-methyltransferase
LRAVYIQDLEDKVSSSSADGLIILTGDLFHHLQVARVNKSEEIKLFNGQGLIATALVENLSKKSIDLKILGTQTEVRNSFIDVLLGIPKREALESCIKLAVELKVNNLFLFESKYSQKVKLEEKRVNALVASAIEQSNNPWSPNIIWLEDITDFKEKNYTNILFFQSEIIKPNFKIETSTKNLLIIGPEGGWSKDEHEYFLKFPNAHSINLATAIMRTPTAMSCAVGFLHGYSEA